MATRRTFKVFAMKKLSILLFICIIIFFGCKNDDQDTDIPYENITDESFLFALIDQGVDTDGDSMISAAEAEAVISLDISAGHWQCPYISCYFYFGNIKSLKGIELFINLDTLKCSGNVIDSLDLSSNTLLRYLDCSLNGDSSLSNGLNLSNCTSLTYLDCSQNAFTELDVSNLVGLREIYCYKNKITSLDVNS